MSLLEELAQNGVTAEDLEKAASVRLFEKVATDQGINLNELNDDEVHELFNHFLTDVLPQLEAGGEQQVAPVNDAEKAASVLLFQKQADAEGIDLSQYDEAELNQLYGHFLENVLPHMFESHEEEKAAAADVEEAQAKLAEVEILGRHMAHAFYDESEKIAEGEGMFAGAKQKARNVASGLAFEAGRRKQQFSELSNPKKALVLGGGLAAAGAAGYGAKKGYEKYKEKKAGADEVGAAIAIFENLGLDVDLDLVDYAYTAKEAEDAAGMGAKLKDAASQVSGGAGYLLGGAENWAKKHPKSALALGALGAAGAGYGAKKGYDKYKEKKASADEIGAAIAIFEGLGLDVDFDMVDYAYAAKEAGMMADLGEAAKMGRETGEYGTAARMGAERIGQAIKANPGKSVAGLAALGAAGYGAKKLHDKRKAKTASAFDKLAEERANEILAANGVESTGSEEQLDQLVTMRAIEMLENAGYTFE